MVADNLAVQVAIRHDVGFRAVMALNAAERLATLPLKRGETSADRLTAVALFIADQRRQLAEMAQTEPVAGDDPDPGDVDPHKAALTAAAPLPRSRRRPFPTGPRPAA